MENWKPIPGFEGSYDVSDIGRVRSRARINARGHRQRERILSGTVDARGYVVVHLRKDKQSHLRKVHQLVLSAFEGDPPTPLGNTRSSTHVNHKDGDKQHNDLANLEYVTPQENHAHASRIGLRAPKVGTLNGRARLTAEDVVEMRRLVRETGATTHKMAERFGVSPSTANYAINGTTWNHLPGAVR